MIKINPSEITPEHVYSSRRKFMVDIGPLVTSSFVLGPCRRVLSPSKGRQAPPPTPASAQPSPHNSIDSDNLLKLPQKERTYRLRCVEAWSMVIPWVGLPLAKLLQDGEPMSKAQYLPFQTLYDPHQLPGQKRDGYNWPYIEGLPMDKAMHDLTILATGLYGKSLLPQNGVPVRLVVPWKYGFKSYKSVVKIDLVEEMPTSLWMAAAPHEYGFYANVNPRTPSALVPGHRAPDRRKQTARDPPFQWVRPRGG